MLGWHGNEVLAIMIQVGHVQADIVADLINGVLIVGDDAAIEEAFVVEGLLKVRALVAVVEELDGLLERKGEQKADRDGGDVNEELTPGVGGMRRGMDVDHSWPK